MKHFKEKNNMKQPRGTWFLPHLGRFHATGARTWDLYTDSRFYQRESSNKVDLIFASCYKNMK